MVAETTQLTAAYYEKTHANSQDKQIKHSQQPFWLHIASK